MTDYALSRARAGAQDGADYPVAPVIGAETPCDGLCLVGAEEAAALATFRRLREHIDGVWRLDMPGLGRQAWIATFARPVLIADREAPGALRLARDGAHRWSSFRGETGAAPSAGPRASARREVRLWWSGADRALALEDSAAVSLEALWGAADLVVHRSSPQRGDTQEAAEKSAHMEVSRAAASESFSRLPDALSRIERDIAARERRSSLSSIFARAFGGLLSTRAAGPSPTGGSGPWGAARPTPREPSLLSQITGWLRWHTPFGAPLKNQLARRLDHVDRLIRSGAIDEALRLAFKLGSGAAQRAKSIFPHRLPDARASLDFNVDHSRFSIPVLGHGVEQDLRQRYEQLAKDLAARGDFRRAAYVQSQLLGNHQQAIKTLEAGGLLAEAAKLAHDSGSHPSIVIRLLYLLGDHDNALALAKRTACFDALAAMSRNEHPGFHAFVIKAWTDQLVATNQFVRALQITDDLVKGHKAANTSAPLLAARRSWLVRALTLSPPERFDAELIVRALTSMRWTSDDVPEQAIHDFGAAAPIRGREPFLACVTALRAAMDAPDVEARPALLSTLRAFVKLADASSEEQEAFWKGPAAYILEPWARSVLRNASDGLRGEDLGDLQSLLLKASLPVLAEDFRRLRSVYRSPAVVTGATLAVPIATDPLPAVTHACVLADGAMLVARQIGTLEFRNARGTQIWSDVYNQIIGLVPVGGSGMAIVLQRADGGAKLSLFSSHDQSIRPIGITPLRAWHDLTSETQWLVQIEGEVGALDLSGLVSETPRIVFLWSMQITTRLITRAFFHDPLSPSWITLDISSERGGVHEAWTLWQGRELKTRILTGVDARHYHRLRSGGGVDPLPIGRWRFNTHGGMCTLTSLNASSTNASMYLTEWSDASERSLAAVLRSRASTTDAVDAFQSVDFGRVHTLDPVERNGQIERGVGLAGAKAAGFTLRYDTELDLRLIARAPTRRSGGEIAQIAVFADKWGRLHRLDVERGVLGNAE